MKFIVERVSMYGEDHMAPIPEAHAEEEECVTRGGDTYVHTRWVIEVGSVLELMHLVETHGRIILRPAHTVNMYPSEATPLPALVIYDDYIE